MESKSRVKLDELDMKLLGELPLISEVLTSTTNKLVRIFTPIFQSIHEVCLKHVPVGWEIDKKMFENVIFAFSSNEDQKKVKILENFFQLKNSIVFVKKQDKKWLNYVEVQFGFYYDEDYEENRHPYFYFYVSKDPSEKYSGVLFPLEYYEGISDRLAEYSVLVEHPRKGNEWESFEIQISLDSYEKIFPACDIFANEILPDYLKKIGE